MGCPLYEALMKDLQEDARLGNDLSLQAVEAIRHLLRMVAENKASHSSVTESFWDAERYHV